MHASHSKAPDKREERLVCRSLLSLVAAKNLIETYWSAKFLLALAVRPINAFCRTETRTQEPRVRVCVGSD